MVTSSQKSRSSARKYYKKKILLLGGVEQIKDRFQEIVSKTGFSLKNKNTIGVNISKVPYNKIYDFYLWNISCKLERVFVRTMYYTGAEAVIVFISEDNVEQMLDYYKEIIIRLPVITILFCIILKDKTVQDIKNAYFSTSKFLSLLSTHKFEFNKIFDEKSVFSQISSLFRKNMKEGKLNDHFVINFIPLMNIVNNKNNIKYTCEDYFEPEQSSSELNRRLNTKILKKYLYQLKIPFRVVDSDWIILDNKNLGEFSIFLRNGDAYFTPKNCLNCKNYTCMRKKRINNFICIEAKSKGWSNIEGIYQKELLVLSKILILNDAEEESLPKAILKQIKSLESCIKEKD